MSQLQTAQLSPIQNQAIFEKNGLPPQFNLDQFINYQIASLQGLSAVQQAMAKAQVRCGLGLHSLGQRIWWSRRYSH